MNHTFPLLPIFTAAAQLDLLERFIPRWLKKTRSPECSSLRFSQSLCFLILCINNRQWSPLTLKRTQAFMPHVCVCVCVCELKTPCTRIKKKSYLRMNNDLQPLFFYFASANCLQTAGHETTRTRCQIRLSQNNTWKTLNKHLAIVLTINSIRFRDRIQYMSHWGVLQHTSPAFCAFIRTSVTTKTFFTIQSKDRTL